jgi:hypothetical protein
MKKLASVLGIIIVISFVLMFSSCVGNSQEPKEPTTADELYELIEEKMDALRNVLYAENLVVRNTMLSLIEEPEDKMYSEIPLAADAVEYIQT